MQEVDIKLLKFSIYFTYVSVSNPMCAQEISVSRFVELCFGVVVSKNNLTSHTHTHTNTDTDRHTHTHTHTHIHTLYFLKTSLTIFFPHHSQFTSDILAASLSRTETDRTLFSAVSVYRLAPAFPGYLLQ